MVVSVVRIFLIRQKRQIRQIRQIQLYGNQALVLQTKLRTSVKHVSLSHKWDTMLMLQRAKNMVLSQRLDFNNILYVQLFT